MLKLILSSLLCYLSNVEKFCGFQRKKKGFAQFSKWWLSNYISKLSKNKNLRSTFCESSKYLLSCLQSWHLDYPFAQFVSKTISSYSKHKENSILLKYKIKISYSNWFLFEFFLWSRNTINVNLYSILGHRSLCIQQYLIYNHCALRVLFCCKTMN